jgi:hypothetical protein
LNGIYILDRSVPQMPDMFRLEKVGEEGDITFPESIGISGYGSFTLTNSQQVEYHFNKNDMSLEEAETYIANSLNNLPEETIDEICEKACAWKNDKMSSDSMPYPDGLAEARGREILRFIEAGNVVIYKNPHDGNDTVFGAVIGGGVAWDDENGMEIIIKGDKVLEVGEFFGYYGYSIWNNG